MKSMHLDVIYILVQKINSQNIVMLIIHISILQAYSSHNTICNMLVVSVQQRGFIRSHVPKNSIHLMPFLSYLEPNST